jgi:hypothetical protein
VTRDLLDTPTAELPGVIAQTPATRPDLSRYKVIDSTELQSRGEASRMLRPHAPDELVKRVAGRLTARRREAERARAWACKRERQRWAGVAEGEIAPMNTLDANWLHYEKSSARGSSRAGLLPEEVAA